MLFIFYKIAVYQFTEFKLLNTDIFFQARNVRLSKQGNYRYRATIMTRILYIQAQQSCDSAVTPDSHIMVKMSADKDSNRRCYE